MDSPLFPFSGPLFGGMRSFVRPVRPCFDKILVSLDDHNNYNINSDRHHGQSSIFLFLSFVRFDNNHDTTTVLPFLQSTVYSTSLSGDRRRHQEVTWSANEHENENEPAFHWKEEACWGDCILMVIDFSRERESKHGNDGTLSGARHVAGSISILSDPLLVNVVARTNDP